MMPAIVAPLRLNRPTTRICFECARVLARLAALRRDPLDRTLAAERVLETPSHMSAHYRAATAKTPRRPSRRWRGRRQAGQAWSVTTMHAPFDKEVECNLASSGQNSPIGFPTREPLAAQSESVSCNSTTAQLKREPSALGVLPVSSALRIRTGRNVRDTESSAEPQQRLTQLLEHLPATVEKGKKLLFGRRLCSL